MKSTTQKYGRRLRTPKGFAIPLKHYQKQLITTGNGTEILHQLIGSLFYYLRFFYIPGDQQYHSNSTIIPKEDHSSSNL